MTHIIIVAAGSGLRFGKSLPKQFCALDGKPVLMHTIGALAKAVPDGVITLVLSNRGLEIWKQLCQRFDYESPQVVIGGNTRFESVRNAILALRHTMSHDDIVMIHDGARPFVSPLMTMRLAKAARNDGAAIPVVPVTSSLRYVCSRGNETVSKAVDRSQFVEVQTPQAFTARILAQAYSTEPDPRFTDDASVVEHSGHSITLVDGDAQNIKITNPGDLDIALAILHNRN